MIQIRTVLKVLDNSGPKTARCIGILGPPKKFATVGDKIVVTAEGKVYHGIVACCKVEKKRPDGSFVRIDQNGVILVDSSGKPVGNRVFGVLSSRVKQPEILSLGRVKTM
ncbi:hypothetical protein GAYE_SCF05G2647 [Galdieria yellowstonensis]|jgi:large subunit ribosomal protein L14|uniref:50S ribosomal protein L14 n=1 Tax=Galdieria yellowstonensis TaxID=3028027 RepID=A0AAV9IBP0_9RHOD|nr:hypothetical protein GAYE_SCF05G2647 [Galdieria yellowstonensis]